MQQSPHPIRGGFTSSPRANRNAVGWQSGGPASKSFLPESSSPPPPYDYSPRLHDKTLSPRLGSPTASYAHKQPPSRVEAVLASDEKYPVGAQSYVSRGSPAPGARTIPSSMPRYGSPTFPPPTTRDGNDPASAVPLSVAAAGVQAVPGAVRRPMSFVRALEMSDQLTGAPAGRPGLRQHPSSGRSGGGGGVQETIEEDERAFGSNYEIAV